MFYLTQFNSTMNNNNKTTVIKPNFKKIINNLGMIRDNMTGNLIIEFEIKFPNTLSLEQITSLESSINNL